MYSLFSMHHNVTPMWESLCPVPTNLLTLRMSNFPVNTRTESPPPLELGPSIKLDMDHPRLLQRWRKGAHIIHITTTPDIWLHYFCRCNENEPELSRTRFWTLPISWMPRIMLFGRLVNELLPDIPHFLLHRYWNYTENSGRKIHHYLHRWRRGRDHQLSPHPFASLPYSQLYQIPSFRMSQG